MKIIQIIILFIATLVFIIISIYLSNKHKKLDNIKSKEVGDGQHGSARFMNEKEMKSTFSIINLPEELIDMSDTWKSGRIINFDETTREAYVDYSDTHAKIVAPTLSEKTTSYVIPNVQYNIMAGTSMIIPDMKGEIKSLTKLDAERLGYKTYEINFENIFQSNTFDYFDDINTSMDHYITHHDLQSKAESEDSAGELAHDIVNSRKRSDNENSFFIGASEGVIHSVVQLISMFGKSSQKHLSSVNNIIQEMLQKPKKPQDKTPQIIKLIDPLPQNFGAKKYLGAAFAAAQETESNIYASVLGDLRPYINSLAEQVIANPESDSKFSYMDLIGKKTILYIIFPEHKPQFRVYAQTMIKKIYNQLASYSTTCPERKLPRRIYLLWEEFGLYEKIDSIHDWLAYARSMGFIMDLIYQDAAQITEKYGDNIEKILSNQCAISIYLALGQEDLETAEKLSKVLGTKTIKTGSVSISHGDGGGKNNNLLSSGVTHSETENMMERPLMYPSEILHMHEYGIRLLLKRDCRPMRCHLTQFFKPEWGIFPTRETKAQNCDNSNEIIEIDCMSLEQLLEAMTVFLMESNHQDHKSKIIPSMKIPSIDHYQIIVKKLMDQTGDAHAIELLYDKKYKELYQYMDQYKMKISRLELNQLLEPLIERS